MATNNRIYKIKSASGNLYTTEAKTPANGTTYFSTFGVTVDEHTLTGTDPMVVYYNDLNDESLLDMMKTKSKANNQTVTIVLEADYRLIEYSNVWRGSGTAIMSAQIYAPYRNHASSTLLTINHTNDEASKSISFSSGNDSYTWSQSLMYPRNDGSYVGESFTRSNNLFGNNYPLEFFHDSNSRIALFTPRIQDFKASPSVSNKVQISLTRYSIYIQAIEAIYFQYYLNDTLITNIYYELDNDSPYVIRDETVLSRYFKSNHQHLKYWTLKENTSKYQAGKTFSPGAEIKNWTFNLYDNSFDYKLEACIKEYCTVNYYQDDNTTKITDNTKEENEYFSFSGTNPTKTGSTFKGWTNKTNCKNYSLINTYQESYSNYFFIDKDILSTTKVQVSMMSDPGTANRARTIDLYPVWETTYTVTYNNGNNTIKTDTAYSEVDYTLLSDTNIEINGMQSLYKNKKFLGWSLNSSATTASYQSGDSISASLISEDIILYAVWQDRNSITFIEILPDPEVQPATITVNNSVDSDNGTYYFDSESSVSFSIAIDQAQEAYFIESVTANTTTNLITNGSLDANRKNYTSGSITTDATSTDITITITYIEGLPAFYLDNNDEPKRAMKLYWEDTRAIGLYYENTRLL